MLDRVDEIIDTFVSELNDKRSRELFEKISSGKKLRAKLILKIASNSEDAPFLAAIVELIHAASLLHDDVIDDALTRRGNSSINALFGNKSAIMLGDILYSKAFYELTSLDKEVAKVVSNAVVKLSIGELMDVELSKEFNEDEDLYFDMIYKKTASLIEAASKSAALLEGVDSEKFALYGKNLGLAFQIIDDILDITAESSKLGKPSMHDFFEGKVTLPYIKMYKKLDEDDKKRLLKLYKKELDKSETEWIREKMKSTEAIKESVEIVNFLADEALLSIKEYQKDDLERVVRDMVEREY